MKTFSKLISLLFVLLITLTSMNLQAALDSKGTDFWIMFNTNIDNTGSREIFITSDLNTSGVVDVPGLGFSQPFVVAANTVVSVVVPMATSSHTSDVIDNLGIHVTALQEVTVYGLNYRPFSTDAYLALPVDILGTDYTVLTYPNSNIVNGVEFGIVGVVNGTTVTITPSVTTGPRIAGVPYNIVLNQGETYELRNISATGDLTGTNITSTQPIGVMGASQCSNIPSGYVYCDHICEMIPPSTTWGKNFVTVPLKSRVNGDTWRMMASQNATTVSIDAVAQPVINAGQFIEVLLTGQSIITSDKPILLAQYSNGSSFSGNPGDPFMMIIPPYEQYLAGYTLTTVSGYVAHYINVVAPNAVVGSLTLDAVIVPVIEYTPIGASGFSGAQLTVLPGSHTLAATLPFGAFQYGFNNDDSYGYPGGLSLAPIATVTSLDVTPEDATNPINTQHCVDGLVLDNLGIPVVGVRVDFLIKGVNAGAGFAFTNASGIAQYCYTGTVAGRDTIIGSTGNLVDTVFKTWTGGGPICDPGTPHIEILDHPSDPVTHLEGRYIYQREYLPYFPNDTAFSENHCGLNVLKPVDPCNPWVLDFYVAYFEDEDDMVKVLRPEFNWDTLLCQDMRFEVVYPAGFDYTYSTYYDSVVMKVTMIPHATDTCTLPPVNYVCSDGHVITNYACWVNCMNELLTFRCIDSCEVPNEAVCRMEFDKPLPVELNSFTAIAENENVILNWTTVTEKDNAGFDIERRSDGIWTKIGYVSGKGNSDVTVDYAFIDRKLNSGSYGYRLKQIDFNGNFEYYDLSGYVNIGVPVKFSLSQNYPNPFNPVTKIDFTLPISENVMLKIYDLSGREIVTVLNEFRTAGYYTVDFNAANLASGVYYYKLTAGNNTAVNKMIVVK